MGAESVGVWRESVTKRGICLRTVPPAESFATLLVSPPALDASAAKKQKKGPGCPGPLCEVFYLSRLNWAAAVSLPIQAVIQRRDREQRNDAAVADDGLHADWGLSRKQKRGARYDGGEDCR